MNKQSARNSDPSNLKLTKQCKFTLSGCLHTRKCIVRDFKSHRGAGEDLILLERKDL